MKIKIKTIYRDRFQSRGKVNEKEVATLAASIKACGLLHPIVVREIPDGFDKKGGQQYELIAGGRRIAAHELLGFDEIDANVIDATDSQAVTLAAAENIERKNLKPLEEAAAIDKALAESSIEDIATAFGRSPGQISRIHRLTQLSKDWKKAVESGFAKDWSIALLVEVARTPEEIQKKLYEQYQECGNGWRANPTAEEIRKELFEAELIIKSACFDSTDCLKCQKSTCATPGLFDDIITAKKGDRCLDIGCWDAKKNDALKVKAEKFKSENPKGVLVSDYTVPEELKKHAVSQWDCMKAKKTDKSAVPALNLATGHVEYVKLNKTAADKAAKVDTEGKLTMKVKRARLEKRRVIRFLEKIVAVIQEMIKNRHEFSYAAIVPLVSIFGADPVPDKKGYLSCGCPLDRKFNDDHAQTELFLCIAPKMINALANETRAESPQKKRGDVFREWLEIDTKRLWEDATVEIPDPKSWATAGTKKEKNGTKPDPDETKSPAVSVRTCRVCGCTDTTPCIDGKTGDSCCWIEDDLCSACACKACKQAHPDCKKCCAKCKKPCNGNQACRMGRVMGDSA